MEYSVDIVNVGTIPARVNEIKVSNLGGTEHIEIKGLEVITTEHPTINPKDKCNIHFTVEWPKEKDTEIEGNEETTFELQIEYTQATTENFDGQPSHEDIVGNTAGGGEVIPPALTPVKLSETITGEDYGKAINYKAIVQGKEVSNWRVFFNDGKNVYIILDDYLPNTLVPASAGLQINGTYGVYSNENRQTLLNGLIIESYWSEFANGVNGATATGTPTYAQFVTSWNENPEVNESKIVEGNTYKPGYNGGYISNEAELYMPHTEGVDNCMGYWIALFHSEMTNNLWCVSYNGDISSSNYVNNSYGIRPVVCLPSNVTGTVGEVVEIQ